MAWIELTFPELPIVDVPRARLRHCTWKVGAQVATRPDRDVFGGLVLYCARLDVASGASRRSRSPPAVFPNAEPRERFSGVVRASADGDAGGWPHRDHDQMSSPGASFAANSAHSLPGIPACVGRACVANRGDPCFGAVMPIFSGPQPSARSESPAMGAVSAEGAAAVSAGAGSVTYHFLWSAGGERGYAGDQSGTG